MTEDGKYILESDADREAAKFIRTWDRTREDFGNAREVRSFFEWILPVQAMRLAENPDLESLSNEQLLTITADDIKKASKW